MACWLAADARVARWTLAQKECTTRAEKGKAFGGGEHVCRTARHSVLVGVVDVEVEVVGSSSSSIGSVGIRNIRLRAGIR